MSDMDTNATPETTLAPPAANPVVASATQALAIKELGETVDGMKKKIKTLWIAVAVLAVVTIVVGVFAIGPRFGLNIGGGAGFRGNGQFPTGAPGNMQRGPSGAPDQDTFTQP